MNLEPRIEAVSCKLNSHVYPVNTIACTKVQFFDNFLRPKVPEGLKFVDDFFDEEKIFWADVRFIVICQLPLFKIKFLNLNRNLN